jgi:hypothetical protein
MKFFKSSQLTAFLTFLFLSVMHLNAQNTCADAIPIPYSPSMQIIPGSTVGVPNDNAQLGGINPCFTEFGASDQLGQQWFTYTWTGCDAGLCGFEPVYADLTIFTGTCGNLECVGYAFNGTGIEILLSPGVTYYIWVGHFAPGFAVDTEFYFYLTPSVTDCDPSPAATCASAAVLPVTSTPVAVSASNIPLGQGDFACANSLGPWYQFTWPAGCNGGSTTITFNTVTTNIQPIVHLASGDCDNLTCLGQFVYGSNGSGSYSFNTTAGETYYIRISDTYQLSIGSFEMTLNHNMPGCNPPSGSTCATAIPVVLQDGDASFINSTNAVSNDNMSSGAPFCGTSVGTGGQRWFTFSMNNCSPVQVTLSTGYLMTNYDTKIHVYSGTCGSLTCVAGDDDSGPGLTSQLTFTAQPGTTYYFRVGGYNSASGTFFFSVETGESGCTDPAACNYNPDADWNDCSCCYNNCISLSLNQGDQPAGNWVTLYDGDTAILTVNPGESAFLCADAICNGRLEFTDINYGTWGTASYSFTMNGVVLGGAIPNSCGGLTSEVTFSGAGCGCTDPSAFNYNSLAQEDDGSCLYAGVNNSCANSIGLTAGDDLFVSTYGIGEMEANYPACDGFGYQSYVLWYRFDYQGGVVSLNTYGTTEDNVMAILDDCNGNVIACADDSYSGTNASIMLGCTNGLVKGQTYYVLVGLKEGQQGYFRLFFDQFDIPGCINEAASNYNPCASIDDGSCDSCPADIDNSGFVNVTDLLMFVSAYGSVCN